jgi:opacity protein-like surface antigen
VTPVYLTQKELLEGAMITARDGRCIVKNIVYFCIVLASCGNMAYADGYEEKDFSLRFPAALSRFSSYADVAAVGGASAGSKWQSSVNPASTGWQSLPGSYRISLNPQYSAIMFEKSTNLHVISESITKQFEKFGTLQVSLAQVRSNERAQITPSDLAWIAPLQYKFAYDMNYGQVQWGKRFTDDFALGLNFNYSASEVTNKIGTDKIADSTSDSYGVRAGALYRLATNLLGGIVVDYSQSPSTTTIYDIYSLGTGNVIAEDTTRQFMVRVGPSYEYRKDSTLNLDYQYGSFKNDMGTMGVHRMFAGIDHRIIDALFVRGGFALDNEGNKSWTGGLGIYPLKQLSIDVGYQYNMFPEIKSEFGRSQLVTISLSVIL